MSTGNPTVNTARPERQPHLYGAHPYQYRQGTNTTNTDTPPSWSPEQAYDPVYPYTLEELSLIHISEPTRPY